jgi:hypothetical protein
VEAVTVTAAAPVAGVPRISPVALEQRLRRLFRRLPDGPNVDALQVVLIRAAPVWDGGAEFTVDGIMVTVVPCVSALAVPEQVTVHGPGGGRVLVLLTDQDEGELGDGVLSLVYRHRVHTVEPWALVEECFGAAQIDPALTTDSWACQALVDAMPAEGWPRLPGTVLSRDTALRNLAARRLDLYRRLGLGPDGLDASALLRWSTVPDAPEAFVAATGADERQGLVSWLVTQTGATARTIFALVEADRGGDALPLGLVCACLWGPGAGPDVERPRGSVDSYIGRRLGDDVLENFGEAAREVAVAMLAVRPSSDGSGEQADDRIHAVLDRAEDLLTMFGATEAGRRSEVLRSGFGYRVAAVASALRAYTVGAADGRRHSGMSDPAATADLVTAVESLGSHHLARWHGHRVARAVTATRLARWLAADTSGVASHGTVGAFIDAHIADTGWVDAAIAAVYDGEDVDASLAAAYKSLYELAAARRRTIDEAFASHLAGWTASGAATGEMLVVESVLERIVAPLVRAGGSLALLIVLDGMSAAAAIQIAEGMRRLRWQEYDPLGVGPGARRRAAVAVLPTLTSVSRASLFAGRLAAGTLEDESRTFENHRLWAGRRARLFHRAGLHGGPGTRLARDLTDALTGDDPLVAVVINTIDDALHKGREGSDPGWTVDGVGPLRVLVDQARAAGRAVIITSDHGHVLDHGTRAVPAAEPLSARHRTDSGPGGPGEPNGSGQAESVAPGEVRLAGSRVLAPGGRVVALWDPFLRYAAARAGYHGGASLAEVTVPVLAFLPFAADGVDGVPRRWRALPDPTPGWWSLTEDRPALAAPRPVQTAPPLVEQVRRGPRRRPAEPEGQATFDLPTDTLESEPTSSGPVTSSRTPNEALVADLLASEVFRAQHALTPRGFNQRKVADAVTAMLDAGSTLATPVVAERAGEHPVRALGFARMLQRVFNVDNYPVLSLIDDERTLRLDVALLREQFGLRVDGVR